MNILLLLLPKGEVVYEFRDHTLRNLVEKMDAHNLTALPIIDNHGKYVKTLSEGDVLRYLKHNDLDLKRSENVKISDINARRDIRPVTISCDSDELCKQALSQDFIPVIDDTGIFIGIVTLAKIMNYLLSKK